MTTMTKSWFDLRSEGLAKTHGLTLLPDRILRVKESRNHHIDLIRMLFNWRLVTTPVDCDMVIDRGWCYLGTHSFDIALEEARKWPDDESDKYTPERWYKEVHTGRMQPQYFYPRP